MNNLKGIGSFLLSCLLFNQTTIASSFQPNQTQSLTHISSQRDSFLMARSPFDQDLLALTNRERTSRRLPALGFSPQLGRAAQLHAEDMARNNFISHTGSDGSDVGQRVQRTGYQFNYIGENVYQGGSRSSPVNAVQGWMNSPGHRGNILNQNYTEIGFGYAFDGRTHWFVQVFGRSSGATNTQPNNRRVPNSSPSRNRSFPGSQSPFDQELLALTNRERTQRGLPALRFSPQLGRAAQLHGEDMARNNFMSHTGSDGSDVGQRAQRAGYQFNYIGENIYGEGPTSSPVNAVQWWMNSPGHRGNILNQNYTEIGFGYVFDGRIHRFVQVFGRSPGATNPQSSNQRRSPSRPSPPPQNRGSNGSPFPLW